MIEQNRQILAGLGDHVALGMMLADWSYRPKLQDDGWFGQPIDFFVEYNHPGRDANLAGFRIGATLYLGLAGSVRFRDWLVNFSMRDDYEVGRGVGAMTRHSGFSGNATYLMAGLSMTLAFKTSKTIVIAGHSQGAAVAVQLAHEIVKYGRNPGDITVVSLAEPVGGDANWIRHLQNLRAKGLTYHWFAHELDPVPWAGAPFTGYSHIPDRWVLSRDGVLRKTTVEVTRKKAFWHVARAAFWKVGTGRFRHHALGPFLDAVGVKRWRRG